MAYVNYSGHHGKICPDELHGTVLPSLPQFGTMERDSRKAESMKIVIIATGKSGSTGLYFKIKNSLPRETVCLFEPDSLDAETKQLMSQDGTEPFVLAKVLAIHPPNPFPFEDFLCFDRKILLTRDPRDRHISALLYGLLESPFLNDEEKMHSFLELLQRKEAQPNSVPVREIHEHYMKLMDRDDFPEWRAQYQKFFVDPLSQIASTLPDLFVLKYEDFVDDQLTELESYLGLPLRGPAVVDREFSRVERTRSYGGWKDWYTHEDIEFYEPVFTPLLERYDYSTEWKLNSIPVIDPRTTSEYFIRITNERRNHGAKNTSEAVSAPESGGAGLGRRILSRISRLFVK